MMKTKQIATTSARIDNKRLEKLLGLKSSKEGTENIVDFSFRFIDSNIKVRPWIEKTAKTRLLWIQT